MTPLPIKLFIEFGDVFSNASKQPEISVATWQRGRVFSSCRAKGVFRWPMSSFLYISFGKKKHGERFLWCCTMLKTIDMCWKPQEDGTPWKILVAGSLEPVPITHEKKGTLKISTQNLEGMMEPSRFSFSGVENPTISRTLSSRNLTGGGKPKHRCPCRVSGFVASWTQPPRGKRCYCLVGVWWHMQEAVCGINVFRYVSIT